jgi:hypothetical protein
MHHSTDTFVAAAAINITEPLGLLWAIPDRQFRRFPLLVKSDIRARQLCSGVLASWADRL